MSEAPRAKLGPHHYVPERSCGKWVYRSRATAERFRKELFDTQGEIMHVYGCAKCGFFHLSSKTPRQKRRKVVK